MVTGTDLLHEVGCCGVVLHGRVGGCGEDRHARQAINTLTKKKKGNIVFVVFRL